MPKYYAVSMLIVLFMFFGISDPVSAATEDNISTVIENFAKTCLEDTKEILTAPGQWEREAWLKAALIGGTTLVLFESDQSIRDFFQQHRTGFDDDLSGVLDKVGNIYYLAPAVGLWYLYGRAAGNSKVQETALISLESMLIAGGFTGVLKVAFQRSRPYTQAGSRTFDGPALAWDDEQLSFSSMHSATAFAMATVVAESYQDQPWVPVVAYTTASLVALSRLNEDEHWSSDVFFGSVVGYFTAKKVLALRSKKAEEMAAVSLIPAITAKGASLVLEYRF